MSPNSEFAGACRAVDGASIFFRAWTPAAEPGAVLLFVHGLAELIGHSMGGLVESWLDAHW